MASRPRVATLEALIIDTFTNIVDGKEVQSDRDDQIGGAGTYAIIGARVFLPPERLAMVVDCTETFPAEMRGELESFGADMWEFRKRTDGNPTTRAVNCYDGEKRDFAYLSPPRLLYPADLVNSRYTTPPAWVHFVSYPDRALAILSELEALEPRGWSPKIAWEPEPPSCIPENLDVIARIASQVDIISPNHTEAMTLFRAAPPADADLPRTVEWVARRLITLRPRVAAVIRAGPLGCCYVLASDIEGEHDPHLPFPPNVPVHWVPPYWNPSVAGYAGAVVDPTGAGNAFMGGLVAALDQGLEFGEACIWANVAASFVIEQCGLPRIKSGETEVWNGDVPQDRVAALRGRMATG